MIEKIEDFVAIFSAVDAVFVLKKKTLVRIDPTSNGEARRRRTGTKEGDDTHVVRPTVVNR